MKELYMPKMGMVMTDGTVVEWHKNVGDRVTKGENLLSIETDKAVRDIEAPCDGILSEILSAPGDNVPVGTVIAHIDDAAEEEYTKGIVYLEVPPLEYIGEEFEHTVAAQPEADSIPASPLAKKIAADAGVKLSSINAEGRIMSKDVLRHIENESTAKSDETIPMSPMRKAIAKNMLNSHMTSPTVTFNLSVDMTEMKRCREQLKSSGIKVSFTDLLVKYVARALCEYPILNSTVDGNNIIIRHYVNMGVAVALDNGLVVPNVRGAESKTLTEISAEVKEMADAAKAGTLSPDRMHGGTFTITNLGMYGIESFSPIINQPEVAILGVNAIEDKPVALNGEIVIRPMMNLSLTADHRVIDGSVAAQFLQRVKVLLENPALILT